MKINPEELDRKKAHDILTDIDEFEKAGLSPVAADIVKAPMLAESPVNMECRLLQILEFGNASQSSSFVIGEVLRIHIQDACLTEGQVASSKLKIIGRLGGGGSAYCRTTDVLKIKRL